MTDPVSIAVSFAVGVASFIYTRVLHKRQVREAKDAALKARAEFSIVGVPRLTASDLPRATIEHPVTPSAAMTYLAQKQADDLVDAYYSQLIERGPLPYPFIDPGPVGRKIIDARERAIKEGGGLNAVAAGTDDKSER